jgi:hypothetical protein
MNGTWRTSVSHTNKVSISQHPPFVTGCYFVYIIMHVPPQPVPGLASQNGLLEILTPPYYERHLARISYKRSFNFSTPPFVTSCYFVYIIMRVPPQPVPGLASKGVVLLDNSAILWTAQRTGVSHTNKSFSFSTPSICYELLLCVHHYACTHLSLYQV